MSPDILMYEGAIQGNGGGETVESVIAAAGYGDGSNITDDDLLNAYKPPAMTRAEVVARYGQIDGGVWPGIRNWLVNYAVPESVVDDPSYHMLDSRGGRVTSFWTNKDLVPKLDNAFHNLQQNGSLGDLDTYDGSLNIRATRGSTLQSAHSWAIAVDFSAATNALGRAPTMSPSVVRAFTDAGFTWGGTFTRPDGMHFSLGF